MPYSGEGLLKHERGASNPTTMRERAAVDVLSAGTADEMAQAARFRNVRAHTYRTTRHPRGDPNRRHTFTPRTST